MDEPNKVKKVRVKSGRSCETNITTSLTWIFKIHPPRIVVVVSFAIFSVLNLRAIAFN